MKNLLFLFALVFAIIFHTDIRQFLGIGGIVFTMTLAPMAFFFVINMIYKKIHYSKDALYVLFIGVVVLIFKWAIGQDYFEKVALFFLVPMILSLCFENLTSKELTILRWGTIIFFMVECGLSITEWTTGRYFFATEEMIRVVSGDMKRGFFRSMALCGFPLANAQIVAVFMAFIAVADFMKKHIQIILFFLGYVALFCFNARGASLVTTVFVAPYFIWKINKTTQQSNKWMIKLGVFCMFMGMFYMVTLTPLGGRLMNLDIIDDSSDARLDVWDFYKHYKHQDDFLWGTPDNYRYIMEGLDAGGVENGVICLILEYGIIFTIPMLLLLFRFQYHKLSVYSKYDKWMLLAVFYIIGNMNTNLVNPQQWVQWIFAYYSFRPEVVSSVKNLNMSKEEQSKIKIDG